MESTLAWEGHVTEFDTIAGNRRTDRRYELQLDVKWKLIRRRRVLDTGVGQTVDMSSGGILFDAGKQLPEGLNVELSITWPVLLHDVAPLQLVVIGRIVRSSGDKVAIQTAQHEFRTVGGAPEQRSAAAVGHRVPPVLTSAAVYATLGNKPGSGGMKTPFQSTHRNH